MAGASAKELTKNKKCCRTKHLQEDERLNSSNLNSVASSIQGPQNKDSLWVKARLTFREIVDRNKVRSFFLVGFHKRMIWKNYLQVTIMKDLE